MEANVSGYLINYTTNTCTWVIVNYRSLYHNSTTIQVGSPLITLYNRNKKYEFQIKISPLKLINDHAYLSMSVETLLCPNEQTGAISVRLSILKSNGDEHDPQEQNSYILKRKTCFNYNTHYRKVTENWIFNGNLTVQVQITFCNDIFHESHDAVPSASVISSSETSILDEYEKLLSSAKFSDVTIVVSGKKFAAHKNILSTRSPVFSAMFEHDMLENKRNIVEIADIKPEVMAEILRFIYADKVNNVEELAADLLVAADKYQLEALRAMCEDIFVKNLNIVNVVEILQIVDRYSSCRRLRNSVLKFLTVNRREVASLEDFDKIFEALSPGLLAQVTKTIMMKL